MQRTAQEIVEKLGGPTKAARYFGGLKAPSASHWLDVSRIPDDRLIEYGARLEADFPGWFSRAEQFGARASEIWPDIRGNP